MAREEQGKLLTKDTDIWASRRTGDVAHVAPVPIAEPPQDAGWNSDHADGNDDLMRRNWNRLLLWLSAMNVELNTIGVPEYNETLNYAQGAIVNFEGALYRANVANGPDTVGRVQKIGTAAWEPHAETPTANAVVVPAILMELAKIRAWAATVKENRTSVDDDPELTRSDGYPIQYSDPAGSTPRRTILNQLLCEISTLAREVLQKGVLEHDAGIPYKQHAIVQYDGKLWRRKTAGMAAWGTGSDWTLVAGVIVPPSAPKVTGVLSGQSYTITWEEPDDGGSPITGYLVERATNLDFTNDRVETNLTRDARDHTAASLTVGRNYHFRVRALNVKGEGNWSDPVSAGTISATAPTAAPTNLRLSRSGASIRVQFNAVPASENGGNSITGYLIFWRSGTEVFSDARSEFVQSQDHLLTLPSGTEYIIAVAARNDVGAGPLSNEQSLTPAAAPDVPRQPTMLVDRRNITVTWNVPEDNGSPLLAYKVQLASDSNFVNVVREANPTAGTQSAAFNFLSRGVRYYARVNARNAIGTSNYSPSSQAPIPALIPSKVTGLTLSSYAATITAMWSAPSNNGSPIQRYQIQIATNAAFTANVQTANAGLSRTFTNLNLGTQYYVRVRAINSVGNGDYSDVESITPQLRVPGLPQNVRIVQSSQNGEGVNSAWEPPADDGGAPINGYHVIHNASSQAGEAGGLGRSRPGSARTSGEDITNLLTAVTDENERTITYSGTVYAHVAARNSVGYGPYASASVHVSYVRYY